MGYRVGRGVGHTLPLAGIRAPPPHRPPRRHQRHRLKYPHPVRILIVGAVPATDTGEETPIGDTHVWWDGRRLPSAQRAHRGSAPRSSGQRVGHTCSRRQDKDYLALQAGLIALSFMEIKSHRLVIINASKGICIHAKCDL